MSKLPLPQKVEPGQESVWDYPRPPRLEPNYQHLQIIFNGFTIADSEAGYRILETSHPPTYYIPFSDIAMEYLQRTKHASMCEWKGAAGYYTITVGDKTAVDAAWFYPNPVTPYQALKDHIAFYAQYMDACYIAGEKVTPQPGNFYGGWITSAVVGPFKGEPNSWGW